MIKKMTCSSSTNGPGPPHVGADLAVMEADQVFRVTSPATFTNLKTDEGLGHQWIHHDVLMTDLEVVKLPPALLRIARARTEVS